MCHFNLVQQIISIYFIINGKLQKHFKQQNIKYQCSRELGNIHKQNYEESRERGHPNGPGKMWKTQIRTGCTNWKANEAKKQMRAPTQVHKEAANIAHSPLIRIGMPPLILFKNKITVGTC